MQRLVAQKSRFRAIRPWGACGLDWTSWAVVEQSCFDGRGT